jgi:membrane protein DedA with SNARE-associated domain
MSAELTRYIAEFGYGAIFACVFLQELGVPNPISNEFVLLFSGYLAYAGVLNFWLVFLTAVAADCIGTTVLYAVFYRFGRPIIERRPKWCPISPERLEGARKRIGERRSWGIFLARLVPFVRGYASVAAGILPIPPRVFLPAVALSAVTWSGGYVIAGRVLGPAWELAVSRVGSAERALWIAAAIVGVYFAGRALRRRRRQAM